MSKPKNRALRPDSGRTIGQLGLLIGLTLTTLVVAVDVNDSTIIKPMLYYFTATGLFALLVWRFLGESEQWLEYSIGPVLAIAYLLASSVSLITAHNSELWLQGLGFHAAGAALFLSAFILFNEPAKINFALRWIAVLTAAVVAFGFVQGYFPSLFEYVALSAGRQFISTFGNASYFAGFLVLVFPLAAALLLERRDFGPARFALAALCIAIIVMIVLTGARSSWIALAITAILFTGLTVQSSYRWYSILAFIAVFGVIFILAPDAIRSRVTNVFTMDQTSSLARRLYFYSGAWKAFCNSPFIGNGLGNFILFLPRFRAPNYWMLRSEDIVPHAHNEYLEILSETGIIGFTAFCVLIGYLCYVLVRAIQTATPSSRIRLSAYFCALLAVLIDNAGSFNLRTYPVALGFWFVAALALRDAGVPVQRFRIPGSLHNRWFRMLSPGLFVIFILWFIPRSVAAYNSDAHFLKGFTADFTNQNEVAEVELRAGLESRPTDAQGLFYYAVAQMKIGKNAEGVLTTQQLLKAYPWYPKARLIQAVCKFESGDTAGARIDLASELQFSTSPLSYYYASYFAYRNHDTTAELQTLEVLLNNALLCGIPDYVVTSLDRYVKLHHAAQQDTVCTTMITRIKTRFATDPEVMTEIVESYGILGRTTDVRATLLETQALPGQKEETARRLREISSHLAATDSIK